MDAASPASLVVWGGFLLACVFGAVAQRSNFCIMGAISDVANMGHWERVRTWMLALAVAILGANLLHFLGLIDLTRSLYQRPSISWLSLLLGGLMFGAGMTLAGGCVNKNLIRLGSGSLRSLVVLSFVAISAYMTLKGLFAQWRSTWLDPVAMDVSALGLQYASLAAVLQKITGMAQGAAALAAALAASLGLLAFVFAEPQFRRNALQIASGLVLGLLAVAAWYLTGHLGYGENRETLETVYFATNSRTLESFSFVAPTAYSLELLMLWTDKSLHPSFGIASAAGIVTGALLAALVSRSFRWEGFASLQDLRYHLTGAVLMGAGGVLALGCTIGQGVSGLSTLALGSPLAVAGIVAGCVATMRWLMRQVDSA